MLCLWSAYLLFAFDIIWWHSGLGNKTNKTKKKKKVYLFSHDLDLLSGLLDPRLKLLTGDSFLFFFLPPNKLKFINILNTAITNRIQPEITVPFAMSTIPFEQPPDLPNAQAVPIAFHTTSGIPMANRKYNRQGSFLLGKLLAIVPCLLIYTVSNAITAVTAKNEISPMKYALSKTPSLQWTWWRSDSYTLNIAITTISLKLKRKMKINPKSATC